MGKILYSFSTGFSISFKYLQRSASLSLTEQKKEENMKLNQMLMKILVELSSFYVNITKRNMSIINFRGLYCTFGTSGKNYKEAHNFWIYLDENTKCNLKLLKNTIL